MSERHQFIQILSNSALDKLPLYATDHELAVAIVGKERATYFKSLMPTLERRGFPPKCPLHLGRAVFLVKLYYSTYYLPEQEKVRYAADHARSAEDNKRIEENLERYKREREEKKARAKANSDSWKARKQNALEDHRAKAATALGRMTEEEKKAFREARVERMKEHSAKPVVETDE